MASSLSAALDALSARIQQLLQERDAITTLLPSPPTPLSEDLTTRINALERACHALNKVSTRQVSARGRSRGGVSVRTEEVSSGELEEFAEANYR